MKRLNERKMRKPLEKHMMEVTKMKKCIIEVKNSPMPQFQDCKTPRQTTPGIYLFIKLTGNQIVHIKNIGWKANTLEQLEQATTMMLTDNIYPYRR
jgi:hypothetical protein